MTAFHEGFLKNIGASLLVTASGKFIPKPEEIPSPPTLWHEAGGIAIWVYLWRLLQNQRITCLEELLNEYPDFRITLFPSAGHYCHWRERPGIWKSYNKGHEIAIHHIDHINLVWFHGLQLRLRQWMIIERKYGDFIQCDLWGLPTMSLATHWMYFASSGIVSTIFCWRSGPTEVVMNAIRKRRMGYCANAHP